MSLEFKSISHENLKLDETFLSHTQITSLPQELREKIFFNLSKSDLQTVVSLNKTMNYSVISSVNFNEIYLVKKFTKNLIQKLNADTCIDQINAFFEIEININYQDFENLISLKNYILDIKVKLINVIKTLDEETIDDLRRKLTAPNFLEDIFYLSKIERKIDEANLILNEESKFFALIIICKTLIRRKYFDKSIMIAESILNENDKCHMLLIISKALALSRKIEKALNIAMSISNNDFKCLALQKISNILAKDENIELALEIAMLITDDHDRFEALGEISKSLVKIGDFDKAIETVMLIANEHFKKLLFNYISKALI